MSLDKEHISFDKVINSLNDTLIKSQHSIYNKSTEDQTSIHVIGAPRSGTTLLTQLLLTYLDIGYINNLTAAFYKSPVYGVRLSRQLLGDNYKSQMTSNYGRTTHIQEPHEFSYFWKMHLNYPDFLQRTYDVNHKVNWEGLKEALYQITLAYEKPVVYKSFQFGFHLQEAVKLMPKTIFLYIERNLLQNAYSILNLRKTKSDNENSWASIKPVQYDFLKNENKYRQIIGQILFLNYEYKKQLSLIPEKNKMFIAYSDLCKLTEKNIGLVLDKVNKHTVISTRDEPILDLNENIKEVPVEIVSEFRKAEDWVRNNFPELKTYNV